MYLLLDCAPREERIKSMACLRERRRMLLTDAGWCALQLHSPWNWMREWAPPVTLACREFSSKRINRFRSVSQSVSSWCWNTCTRAARSASIARDASCASIGVMDNWAWLSPSRRTGLVRTDDRGLRKETEIDRPRRAWSPIPWELPTSVQAPENRSLRPLVPQCGMKLGLRNVLSRRPTIRYSGSAPRRFQDEGRPVDQPFL